MAFMRGQFNFRRFFQHFGRMHRVAVALALLASTTLVGTLGYIAISNMAPLDALFYDDHHALDGGLPRGAAA